MKTPFKKHNKPSITTCTCCSKDITGHFPALAFMAPIAWKSSLEGRPQCGLTSDFCAIDGEAFFIRVVLKIPIIDTAEFLEWGVWVSLSEKNAKRYANVYGAQKELDEDPYFGWFANQLPTYPDCLRIKTQVHLKGGGLRPEIVLDHDNPHPLCQEQHAGITLERTHELAAIVSSNT